MVHEQADEKDLQREIEDLKKKLRRAQRKQTPSSSDVASNDEGMLVTGNAQKLHPVNPILMTRNTLTRGKEKAGRGVGTKVMKKALSQISKSPFTRGIEKAKLPRRFH